MWGDLMQIKIRVKCVFKMFDPRYTFSALHQKTFIFSENRKNSENIEANINLL